MVESNYHLMAIQKNGEMLRIHSWNSGFSWLPFSKAKRTSSRPALPPWHSNSVFSHFSASTKGDALETVHFDCLTEDVDVYIGK